MLTQRQMNELQPHRGWDDGRIGCQCCRLDAIIDLNLRAELTWDDNDLEGDQRVYFNPRLRLETTKIVGQTHQTVDEAVIDLDDGQAWTIASRHPTELLRKHADTIAKLRRF